VEEEDPCRCHAVEDPHHRGGGPTLPPRRGGAVLWRRRARATAAPWRCRAMEEPCHGGGLVPWRSRSPPPWRSRAHAVDVPLRGGGGPALPSRYGGGSPWRRRTHAVEEEEPIAVAPRHCRGSGGRRDVGALGRQALEELQQQRPLENSSR
jgi:hypothetical protein